MPTNKIELSEKQVARIKTLLRQTLLPGESLTAAMERESAELRRAGQPLAVAPDGPFIILDPECLNDCPNCDAKLIAAYTGNPPYWTDVELVCFATSPTALRDELKRIAHPLSLQVAVKRPEGIVLAWKPLVVMWADSEREIDQFPNLLSVYSRSNEILKPEGGRQGKALRGFLRSRIGIKPRRSPGRPEIDERIMCRIIELRNTIRPNGKPTPWAIIARKCNQEFGVAMSAGAVRAAFSRAQK